MSARWTSAALALVATGCVEAVRPTPVQLERAQSQGTAADALESGRILFVTRCTACHVAPVPTSHPPAVWPEEVDAMAGRAHLSPEQRQLIVRYLQVVSEP